MAVQIRTPLPKRIRILWADAGMVCAWLDRIIAPVGALSLVLGAGASLSGGGAVANYLVAGGFLFLLVAWLSDWWGSTTEKPRTLRRARRNRRDTGSDSD